MSGKCVMHAVVSPNVSDWKMPCRSTAGTGGEVAIGDVCT